MSQSDILINNPFELFIHSPSADPFNDILQDTNTGGPNIYKTLDSFTTSTTTVEDTNPPIHQLMIDKRMNLT